MTRLPPRAALTLALGAALFAAALSASPAEAHFDYVKIDRSTLVYEKYPTITQPSAVNHVTISYRSDSTGRYFVISDPASTGITNTSPCLPLTPDDLNVRCPADGIKLLWVDTGNGDNSTTIDAPTAARLYSGPGNDTIRGGSGPTQFYGGPGHDTLTAGPGPGNVLTTGTGAAVLETRNGFPDTVRYCPGRDVVNGDSFDTLTAYCPTVDVSDPRAVVPPAPTPTISLHARSTQPILRQRGVVLEASSNVAGTAWSSGTVSIGGDSRVFRLVRASAVIATPGASVRLRLRMTPQLRRALRGALELRRVVARVVVGEDVAGGRRAKRVTRLIALRR